LVKISKIKKELVQKAVVYNISLEGQDTFFANNILNHNTPPHIIKPKNAKALHWKVDSVGPKGGKTKTDVFAKVVKHPGTQPQPFIRATVRNYLRRIIMDNIRRHLLQ